MKSVIASIPPKLTPPRSHTTVSNDRMSNMTDDVAEVWTRGLLSGLRLGGCLQRLLVGPDARQRIVIRNVRHRQIRPLFPELPRHLAPSLRPHPKLLAEQRDEDPRLLFPEPRQRRHPPQQLRATGGRGPHGGRIAVVFIGDEARQILGPRGHRLGEPVQRGPLGEDGRQPFGVERRELLCGRLVVKALPEVAWRAKCPFQRYLLIE